MNRRPHILAVITLCLAGISAPSISVAAEPEHGMEQMIQAAKSGADHEALAARYDAQAKDLLAQAEAHERMGKRYEALELGTVKGPKFAGHCRKLADNLRTAAREDQELAALHRELAAGMDR
ncbi:MAG: hypothetical protein HYR49_01790 [Gammaproteobacteria bacterium]|nr:hypothetical protein [Gammaproteobacteria bacterium]